MAKNQSFDKYEILGEIGHGSMGIVNKAYDAKKQLVTLKLMQSDSSEWQEFKRQSEAFVKIDHPNIARIYDFGTHKGQAFVVQESFKESLAAKLGGKPMSAEAAAVMVKGLADAISVLHRHDVIYRDLRPSNVQLIWDGTPKIVDLGLAKFLDKSGSFTGPVGFSKSLPYISPEQASGSHSFGQATDNYALGAILYECLTGRPPFEASSAEKVMYKVINKLPVPPRSLNDKVPKELEDICLRCLVKNPEEA